MIKFTHLQRVLKMYPTGEQAIKCRSDKIITMSMSPEVVQHRKKKIKKAINFISKHLHKHNIFPKAST